MKKYLLLALSFFISASLIGGTKDLSECTSEDVFEHLKECIRFKDYLEIREAFRYQKYMNLIPSDKVGDLLIVVALSDSPDTLTVFTQNKDFTQMLKNLSEKEQTKIIGHACCTSAEAIDGFLNWEEFTSKLPKESADDLVSQVLIYEDNHKLNVLLSNEFIVSNISPTGISKAVEYAKNIGSWTEDRKQIKYKINELLKNRWKEILTNHKLSTD